MHRRLLWAVCLVVLFNANNCFAGQTKVLRNARKKVPRKVLRIEPTEAEQRAKLIAEEAETRRRKIRNFARKKAEIEAEAREVAPAQQLSVEASKSAPTADELVAEVKKLKDNLEKSAPNLIPNKTALDSKFYNQAQAATAAREDAQYAKQAQEANQAATAVKEAAMARQAAAEKEQKDALAAVVEVMENIGKAEQEQAAKVRQQAEQAARAVAGQVAAYKAVAEKAEAKAAAEKAAADKTAAEKEQAEVLRLARLQAEALAAEARHNATSTPAATSREKTSEEGPEGLEEGAFGEDFLDEKPSDSDFELEVGPELSASPAPAVVEVNAQTVAADSTMFTRLSGAVALGSIGLAAGSLYGACAYAKDLFFEFNSKALSEWRLLEKLVSSVRTEMQNNSSSVQEVVGCIFEQKESLEKSFAGSYLNNLLANSLNREEIAAVLACVDRPDSREAFIKAYKAHLKVRAGAFAGGALVAGAIVAVAGWKYMRK